MTSFIKKVRGPEEAVIAMEEWIRDYPATINVILFSCFLNQLRSQPILAFTWFQKMRELNIVPNHITLSTMMSAAPTAEASALLMESFLKIFSDIVQGHPNCFNALLTRLRDEGDYVGMHHWWLEMRKRNVTPNAITLSTMMSAAATAEAAVLLMQSFLEDFPEAVKYDPGCFNALLTLLRNDRDYVGMHHWWHEMRNHNITPNAITLSMMMSAAPTAEAAILLMQSFLEDFPEIVKHDPGCFTALLTRLRDDRDYVGMHHWWHEMRNHNITPDAITLSVMKSAAPTADAAVSPKESVVSDHPEKVIRNFCQASETSTSEGGF